MAVSVCRYVDDVYIAIAYVTNDQLTQATEVVHTSLLWALVTLSR